MVAGVEDDGVRGEMVGRAAVWDGVRGEALEMPAMVTGKRGQATRLSPLYMMVTCLMDIRTMRMHGGMTCSLDGKKGVARDATTGFSIKWTGA